MKELVASRETAQYITDKAKGADVRLSMVESRH